jgi:hypothetical protein
MLLRKTIKPNGTRWSKGRGIRINEAYAIQKMSPQAFKALDRRFCERL